MIPENSSLPRPGSARAILVLRGATLVTALAGVVMLQADVQAGPKRVHERGPARTIRVQGVRVTLEDMRRIEAELAKRRPEGEGPPPMAPDSPEEPVLLTVAGTAVPFSGMEDTGTA